MNYNDDREYYNRNQGFNNPNERMRNVVNNEQRRYESQMSQQEASEPTVIGKGARIVGTVEVAGDLVIQG